MNARRIIVAATVAALLTPTAASARFMGGGSASVVHAPRLAATTPIDTGNRAEDSQPAYTARLARAGWDFNPNCDGRHDWYPVGHRCHRGDLIYPPVPGGPVAMVPAYPGSVGP